MRKGIATLALLAVAFCLFGAPTSAQDTVSYADLVALQTTQVDSHIYWCRNCQQTNPCSAGGSGAFALGYSETWHCGAPAGVSGLTAHGFVIGEGANNPAALAACAIGAFGYGQGSSADPICSTLILPNAATAGDLLDASSTNHVGSLADVAAGSVLLSGGVGAVPTYGAVPAAALTTPSATAAFYKSIHSGSTNAVVSNSVASYFPLDGSGTGDVAATIGDASTIWPVVTVKNLHCATYTAGGVLTVAGGTAYTFAVAHNGSASAVTCAETAAISSCQDVTNSITTSALDQLEFIVTPTGTPTALVPKCSVEVDI